MNARTETLPEYVENDHSKYVPVPDDYVEYVIPENRHNMDKTINTQDMHFIKFCTQGNVSLLKGRVGADKGMGKLTCIKHNWSSMVEYVTCSVGLCNRIESLRVGEPNKFSDHCWIRSGFNVGLIRANRVKPEKKSINTDGIIPKGHLTTFHCKALRWQNHLVIYSMFWRMELWRRIL